MEINTFIQQGCSFLLFLFIKESRKKNISFQKKEKLKSTTFFNIDKVMWCSRNSEKASVALLTILQT